MYGFSDEICRFFVFPLSCFTCVLKTGMTPPHLEYSSELGRGCWTAYAKGNIYSLWEYVTEGLERFWKLDIFFQNSDVIVLASQTQMYLSSHKPSTGSLPV